MDVLGYDINFVCGYFYWGMEVICNFVNFIDFKNKKYIEGFCYKFLV